MGIRKGSYIAVATKVRTDVTAETTTNQVINFCLLPLA
jgi:hypothetical protein